MRFLLSIALIDVEHGLVLVQVRDADGRVYPRIAERIWRAIKNEFNLW